MSSTQYKRIDFELNFVFAEVKGSDGTQTQSYQLGVCLPVCLSYLHSLGESQYKHFSQLNQTVN